MKRSKIKVLRETLPIIIIIIISIFSPAIHGYSRMAFDTFPFASKNTFFPARFILPFLYFLPNSFAYFFISLILYIVFKPRIAYAFVLPIIAFAFEDIYIYMYTGKLFYSAHSYLTLPLTCIIILAVIFSILGAFIAIKIKNFEKDGNR